MTNFLLLIECILQTLILIVLLKKKDINVIDPVFETTQKMKRSLKAFGKKDKLKPRVNDDLQAFNIENDI